MDATCELIEPNSATGTALPCRHAPLTFGTTQNVLPIAILEAGTQKQVKRGDINRF